MGEHLLRAQRESSRLFRWKRERLIFSIDVQALCAAKNCGERLIRSAYDIVVNGLRGECGSRRLHVEPAEQRLLVRRAESLLHEACPDAPCCAELCRLLQDVGPRREEEGESWRNRIHLHPLCNSRLHIRDGIGEGEGELLRRSRPRFAHVIPGDADGVPLWQLRAAPLNHIGDQTE